MDEIKDRLQAMSIGRTTTICNVAVVTRWSKTLWEVGTLGRKTDDLDTAAAKVAAIAIEETE